MPALDIQTESWPFKRPFRISGRTFTHADSIRVTMQEEHCVGAGEAAGVFFCNETPDTITAQIEAVRAEVEAGITREELREILPPGGARNALDCALWELEAELAQTPIWQLANIPKPVPLTTTLTVGAGTPDEMAEAARSYRGARALKLKLTGEAPADCVRAVREARPDVRIAVDANGGLTRKSLESLLPELKAANVELIEQPLPPGSDGELDGLRSPIPIAADESVRSATDIQALIGRYNVVNIKLDKSGGLTEALLMARTARRLGLKVMVGCMAGTSLAMAPAFLLGQICDFVDLDAPTFLAADREQRAIYSNGEIWCPENVWGAQRGELERVERKCG